MAKCTGKIPNLSNLAIGVQNANRLPNEILREVVMLSTRMEDVSIPIEVTIRPQEKLNSLTRKADPCISILFRYGMVMSDRNIPQLRSMLENQFNERWGNPANRWYREQEELLSHLRRHVYDKDASEEQKARKQAVLDAITGERIRDSTNFRLRAKFNVKALRVGPTFDTTIDKDDTLLIEGSWYKPSITQSLSAASRLSLTPLQQLFSMFRDIIMPSKMLKDTFQAMLPSFMQVTPKVTPFSLATNATTYDSDGVYILAYTKESKIQRRKKLFRVLNE